ncbi:MAG: ligand-binding sensor domain-containing protein [Peptostreptococcaceae bacterium]
MTKNMGTNTIKIVLLLIVMLNANAFEVKAEDKIKFTNIGVADGLSQSTVDEIYQDSRGYMWIATNDGLNRYNGYEFKVYKYGENKTKTLSSSKIVDVLEDLEGNIWVATNNGLNKIDPKTDNIVRYMDKDNGGSLSNFNITEMLITKDKKFLVATIDGLNLYDEKKDEFIRILGKENELTSQFIYSLGDDEHGNVWVGTSEGLDVLSKQLNPLKKYENNGENSISESAIYNITYDQKGYMWIGTAESGLIKLNIKNNEVNSYIYDEKDKNSIPDNNIRCSFIDKKGDLWIGTSNGLAKYNSQKDNFNMYKMKVGDKNSLVNSKVNSITQDKGGLLWIGTYSGISLLDPNNKIQHYTTDQIDSNSISSNVIHGIYEDEDGILWVGTDCEGVNLIDRKNNIISHIDDDNDKYKLSNYSINDIKGIGDTVYIATRDGLNKIDKRKQKVTIYKKEDGIQSNFISSLFIDSKGYLWVGTSEGLNIINTKDDSIINISENIKLGTNINKYVKSIYEDKEGNYYIGFLRNEGLMKIDSKNNTMKQFKYEEKNDKSISNNYVRCITEDKNGDLWIGTSYGLNKFNKKTEKFTRYTTGNGLVNDTVYGILVDEDNNLWASTNGGISKVNVKEEKFQNFNMVDGLQGNEFNGNAFYKSKSGELLFGGTNGLNIFRPEDIGGEHYNPEVVFERFRINGDKYYNINNKKLKHNQNSLSIKFFVPKYNNSNISYYYKLDGVNLDWETTTNNILTYYELKPGNYIFRIIPNYGNGELGEEKTISFEISPPFWKSKIAILFYITVIITLIYRNKTKVQRLDELVNKRTRQLTDEMEKNNQLFDKVIKLERNKNNYFINLSHELRTPLNVISSTNQLIKELNKVDKGIDKNKLSYYMDISNKNCSRLLRLINNIIDSSKLESDNYVITPKKENIVNIVEEASLSLIEFAKSKGIQLIIDPKIEEKYILCDAYEIERCIVNLVSNAIKFTNEGGSINVTVSEGDRKIFISVKDDGVGIEHKYQESIFNRFNQVIDSNNEIKGGSGLGLTITKQIIDLHKGSIFVESEINKGSNFIITLPIEE